MRSKLHICLALEFNLKYSIELVKGIPENELVDRIGPGLENHAIFTLGHLVTALGLTIKYLGHTYDIPENWDEVFRRKGPGDPRLPEFDSLKYPSLSSILQVLEEKTNELIILIKNLPDSELEKEVKWRFSEHFPSVYDLISFMCVQHSSMHLGQLAAWRRAKGYDSALAKL